MLNHNLDFVLSFKILNLVQQNLIDFGFYTRKRVVLSFRKKPLKLVLYVKS
jgi:hypothetical protein